MRGFTPVILVVIYETMMMLELMIYLGEKRRRIFYSTRGHLLVLGAGC